jgi:hypothetical protein
MDNILTNKIKNNLNKEGLKKVPFFLAIHFSRIVFKFFEKYFKLHITPAHFYSPIPTTYELGPEVFDKIYDCTGIDWNMSGQQANLEEFHAKYYNEYKPTVNIARFSQVDSFILYSFIRERKPAKMIEIGSGESTKVSLAALEMNKKEGSTCEFYAIEPYPEKFLRDIHSSDVTLISKKLQEVDIDLLTSADLLFIDSSHVSKVGSDVNYEILEIIPKLKVGALIHWHDIMIPTNYWKRWIDNGNMFWNESYMVHSFMLFNKSFRVVWASRYLQIKYPDELRKCFSYFSPEDDNQQITSFWIERVL